MSMIENDREMVTWLKKQKLGGAAVVSLVQGGSMLQDWPLKSGVEMVGDAIDEFMMECDAPLIIGDGYKLVSYKGSDKGAMSTFELVVTDAFPAGYDWQLWRSKQSEFTRLTFNDDMGEGFDFDLQKADLVKLRDRLNDVLKDLGE